MNRVCPFAGTAEHPTDCDLPFSGGFAYFSKGSRVEAVAETSVREPVIGKIFFSGGESEISFPTKEGDISLKFKMRPSPFS